MNLITFLCLFFCLIILLWIASRLVVSDADEDRTAKESPGLIEFYPNRRAYWGVYIIVAIMLYPVAGTAVAGVHALAELSVPAFCIAFILFLLTTYPGAIYLREDAMEQTYWFGHRKRIEWNQVRSITVDEKHKRVTVTGTNGAKIVHTRQLPDKARFLAELEVHCPSKMPGAPPKQVAAPVTAI